MLLETKYESFASLILFVYSASSPQTKNSFNGNPTCLTISDEKKQETNEHCETFNKPYERYCVFEIQLLEMLGTFIAQGFPSIHLTSLHKKP